MSHGHFVWYELMTTDAPAASDFYRAVVGWTARDAGMPGVAYTLFATGSLDVAGLMDMPQAARDAGAPPRWIGYIYADDVDAIAIRVEAAGGTVVRGPADIPDVGRFAMVGDPQGATFALFKPRAGSPSPAAGSTPGRIGWHELYAGEWQSAFAFYADLFGWTKAEAIDMGPMGTYQLFAVDGVAIGGMMTKSDVIPRPVWGFYFNVDAAGEAIARIKGAGGEVLNGPHQVPGGSWIVQARDPQGAMFAVVSGVA